MHTQHALKGMVLTILFKTTYRLQPIVVDFWNCRYAYFGNKEGARTKGCLSRKTDLAMAFKLMMSAQTKWLKLDGANRIPEIIQGIAFKDGIKQTQTAA